MTTSTYLRTSETNRPRELTYGVVREPPSPFFSHQRVVLRLARLLQEHVEQHGLGIVAVAPLDVVLDADRALIVQPDVLFVSETRTGIISNQVWGAPDLVVEVCSPTSDTYDRGNKRSWYRQYGVGEYWLVDPARETLTVYDFSASGATTRTIRRSDYIVSTVLPELRATLDYVLS